MKLHRDLGISYPTACIFCTGIRETFADLAVIFEGPVEVDESYFGGLRRNRSNAKRKELEGRGRGPVGKTAVVGIRDRETKRVAAQVVDSTDKDTLQIFVAEHVADNDVQVYTDDTSAYKGLPNPHETVKRTVSGLNPGRKSANYLQGCTICVSCPWTGHYWTVPRKRENRT